MLLENMRSLAGVSDVSGAQLVYVYMTTLVPVVTRKVFFLILWGLAMPQCGSGKRLLGRAGISVLGFAAGGFLLASVPLYFIKKKNALLSGVQWQGRHVDEESTLRLTSRWPRSAACTAGYVCLFAYVLSLGLVPR